MGGVPECLLPPCARVPLCVIYMYALCHMYVCVFHMDINIIGVPAAALRAYATLCGMYMYACGCKHIYMHAYM